MIRRPWPLALLPLAHLGLRSLSAVPAAPSLLGKPVVLDRLCRGWQIHQVKNGYRFNGDDLLLAREAWRAKANSKRLLDLGAGGGEELDVGWVLVQNSHDRITVSWCSGLSNFNSLTPFIHNASPFQRTFHILCWPDSTPDRYWFRGPLLAGPAAAWSRVDSRGSSGGKRGASEQNGQIAEAGAEGAADQWRFEEWTLAMANCTYRSLFFVYNLIIHETSCDQFTCAWIVYTIVNTIQAGYSLVFHGFPWFSTCWDKLMSLVRHVRRYMAVLMVLSQVWIFSQQLFTSIHVFTISSLALHWKWPAEATLLAQLGGFDLVTANPPYIAPEDQWHPVTSSDPDVADTGSAATVL